MKRILVILLSLSVLLVMTACGENKESTSTTGITETTTFVDGNTETNGPAHTHQYVDEVTVATCTEDGYTSHSCACGDSYIDSKVTATGHSFSNWHTTKEPTATETGSAQRKCSMCDEEETKILGRLIDNHKHSYSSKVITQPTCTAAGATKLSCSCGETYTESMPKTSHKYSESKTNPTCATGGYTTHICSACGDSYKDSKTDPIGHKWSAATCTNPKTCSKCGLTEGRAEGHNWKNATCTTPKTCSKCSATEGKAIGHNWDAATCTSPRTCKTCGASEGSAKGHSILTEYETKTDSVVSSCENCTYSKSESVKPLKLNFVKICSHYFNYYRFLSFEFSSEGGYGELTYTFILYNKDMTKIISQCSNETGKGEVAPPGTFKDTKLKVIVRDKYGHSDENVYDSQSLDINWWYKSALSVAEYEASKSNVTPNWYYHTILENRYNDDIINYVNQKFTVDWYKQSIIYAQYCLDRQSYTKDELVKELTDNGFTTEQAVYGVAENGL